MKDLRSRQGLSEVLRGVVVNGHAVSLARPRGAVESQLLSSASEQTIANARREGFEEGRLAALRDAEEQREALIDDACSSARAAGHAEGFEEGRQEAIRRAAEVASEIESSARARVARLETLLQAAQSATVSWRAESESDIVALAFEIARRVIGERALAPSALEEMTRQVLREHGARKSLEVHVHPDDFEVLATGKAVSEWEWVADPAVEAGVVLRSPQGSLDARIETQLRAVADSLLAQRHANKRQRAAA